MPAVKFSAAVTDLVFFYGQRLETPSLSLTDGLKQTGRIYFSPRAFRRRRASGDYLDYLRVKR